MARWIRKVRHGLTSFRVGLPMHEIQNLGWESCRYVSLAITWDSYIVVDRLDGDELVEKNEIQEFGKYRNTTPLLIVPAGARRKWRVCVYKPWSTFVITIPTVLINELGWESCRYVTVERGWGKYLIIRRMPGDARKGDESTKHIAQPD